MSARTVFRSIQKILSWTVGGAVTLLGLALTAAFFLVPKVPDHPEDLVEFVGILAIGISMLLSSWRNTRGMLWGALANVSFWFGLYSVVYYGRRLIDGVPPSTHASLFTLGTAIATAIFGVLAYRAHRRATG